MEHDEGGIEWAKALLEESETKIEVRISISDIASAEVCSIVEAFLESSPTLDRAFFYGINGGEHEAETIDRLLSAAQKNPAIQFINISYAEFRAPTMINLLRTKRASLNTLFLFDSGHSIQKYSSLDAIANAMKECHSLEHIALGELSNPFYVSILKNGLSCHPSLQRLQLNDLGVSDESIATAVQHFLHSSGPNLKCLSMHNCQFSHRMLERIVNGLLRHPTVESLILQHAEFCDMDALPALLPLLQANSNLRSLDLYWTRLSSFMLHDILSALHQNTSLRHLKITRCGLDGDIFISQVQALLLHNETISHLHLYSNPFGASEATLLAHRIQNLTEFECSFCRLGDAGIRALLPLPTVGESHFKLQNLILDGNNITHQGIRHLVEFLQHPYCQIRCLSLCANPINHSGSRILADMLQKNERLTELSLDYSDLSLDGLCDILSSLRHNQALEFLRLRMITDDNDAGSGDENESDYNFLAVYNILSNFVPGCHLKKLSLDLDFDSDYVDESTGSEFAGEDIDRGQDLLLVAFSENTTIEEVKVSNKFFHPQRQKQLAYYTLRNKFQTFIECITDNNGNLTSMEVGGDPHLFIVLTVPRGVWAHILEAAHKRHHNASVLYHLLSSRLDLILAREQYKKWPVVSCRYQHNLLNVQQTNF